MNTYPGMNREIVRLLRINGGVAHNYAAQRIEELEAIVKEAKEIIESLGAFNPEILSLSKIQAWLKKLGE